MKTKTQNCKYYKCNKSFVCGKRKKFCSDECREKDFQLLKKLRKSNKRNEDILEKC